MVLAARVNVPTIQELSHTMLFYHSTVQYPILLAISVKSACLASSLKRDQSLP